MCSKERECTRKRANSDGCYLFEYETGIVFLSSRSQPSTHLKRREHQQPHVQLEDFKKVGHFPCPEPECEQVLPSKQGLSNHRRTAHKSDSSDQPLSSTGRRRQPRRQKSARKDATDMQCCSKNLPPRHKNTERTASSSGRRRRVGSTAADRSAQAAAAACAAGEEALDWVDNNQEERQDMAVVTKRMANLALRRANEEQELRPNYEHETESSDVDEDEYVVESDDDLPAVEHRSSVDMRRESLAEILDLGTSGTLARIGASLFPGKREERWVDPLPEKLQFQQQKNKIAELKCKYSRANAKVRWYKGRKELFSDGSKYEILIDKQSITLIINNLDPDDSGKYKCEANGMPTNAFVTVEGPSIKYVFLTPLPNTMDIYRTKQGVLACKLDSPRAPLVWQRDGKPIDVDDPRYQIENDAAGCFTLTIRVVERIDQGMWTATVNKDVNSKCQVYVVEDPRDTFVVPEQLRNETAANEEKAPDDRDKVPGEPPVTADGKTKYGAENESREKPRLAKRTKQSAPAGRSLRVRGQTSGEPVVLNFDRTRAELELVAPASNCCINVLTPVRPSQRGKYGRSRANTANAGAAPAASTSTARTTRSRVVAINEAGPSAPPTPSTSQICTARLLKPQIITAQRKWKVRAGKTLSLGIKFVGTPDPSVCWVKAGGAGTLPPELIMEDHIKGNTSIFFPAAKRSESGTYELRLKNNVGETEGHFEVLVQDRPAPPKGSLAVDNVARDSCTLSWQPPEDDGGSEVTNYVVECRGVGSQVWVPVNNVVGTNSTVPNLQEGHEYEFRVCAVNAFGCSDPLNTDSAVLAMDPYGPPGRPEVTDHDNNQISIKWAPSTDTGGSPIAYYDVQRKDAKTRRWIKVNTHPVYDCAYTDERVKPGHCYYYRVVAVNEAGLDKPSDQSELAWAKPKFEAPRFELDDINGKEVRVRAGHANTRQYIPKSARSDSGQCRIVATNEKGTTETRGLISVVDRPGPPEGPITYPATTKHSITLSWRPPKDDGGTELSSYRIEFKGLDERDWERVPDHVTLPNYTVRNLEKGAQYQFRVFAENMVGISEPLNGEPVTAKDPFDTPKAQRTRSATVQRKSRRLAPVECAASATQNADKPLAQNTSEERRTTRSAGTGAAPLAAPLTSPRQRVVNAVNGASSLHRLLSLCDNREVTTWDQIGTFSETKKLGEGSYCEVFSTKNHGDVVVMKVVPFQFDGQRRESIGGTGAQPSSSMVHHELLLTKQLSLLSQPNEQHMAASFLQLVGAFVVKGKLPQQIVAAWDYFKTNNDEKAQNRHPDRYVNDEQPFMVMYLNFAGTDLEDFIKKNNRQNTATRRRSIFRQIRLALAIAENVYNLEHRDLHLSNVLVVKFGQTKQLRFKLNGQLIEEETDVKVTIIDYGLSRIEIDGKPYFRQLEGIFEGVGGHFDVYRRMAVATGHKWDQSWPITNTLWLKYLSKMLNVAMPKNWRTFSDKDNFGGQWRRK